MSARWPLLALVLSACGASDPPALSREQLMDPRSCAECHADHYRDWSGSMHAYAAEDPVFLAMNRRGQRETGGALGDFCVKCHAPLAVAAGATTDGLNLEGVASSLKGVTCYFCHTVASVEGSHNNPLRLAGDATMRGPLRDPVKSAAHASAYSPLHDRDEAASATLCGSCHDIVTPKGAFIERTFDEWKGSVFSRIKGATCGQCHMPQSKDVRPIAKAPGVFARRYHGHQFAGVDVALTPFPEVDAQRTAVQDFLGASTQTALCVLDRSTNAAVRVIIDAVGVGHSLPSGSSQDRRLWAEVIAYKGGQVIYQSGVVPPSGRVIEADADAWILRDRMLDAAGKQVHMFWEAACYESDALPAQSTFDARNPDFFRTHKVQSFPRGDFSHTFAGVPDRVTLRLRLEPIGRDVLDDLVASGDLDPAVRDRMPIHDLVIGRQTLPTGETRALTVLEWTPALAMDPVVGFPYTEEGIPVTCVTQSNLNRSAEKFPPQTVSTCPARE